MVRLKVGETVHHGSLIGGCRTQSRLESGSSLMRIVPREIRWLTVFNGEPRPLSAPPVQPTVTTATRSKWASVRVCTYPICDKSPSNGSATSYHYGEAPVVVIRHQFFSSLASSALGLVYHICAGGTPAQAPVSLSVYTNSPTAVGDVMSALICS